MPDRPTPPTSTGQYDGPLNLLVPFAFTAVLLVLSLLPRIRSHPGLTRSLWLVVAILVGWQVLLLLAAARGGFRVEGGVKRVHYIQAAVQLCVYVYWGWYWPQVYEHTTLLIAQIAFAYAFDNLLSWSRGRSWRLGFGPFPIILSTNLFLWFRDDWFFLQFLMIATVFLGKEFVRWRREDRSTHIFNPSALALALFSTVLITTRTSQISWAEEIATTLILPDHIYEEIFLLGLVVMFFFSITEITLSAVLALSVLNGVYTGVTGVYFFADSNIPIAVFLGLHLLITDPATSPRNTAGKIIFGTLYGIGVFALFGVLEQLDAPTFYDKLLCVPFLNLSVRFLDRLTAKLKPHTLLARVRGSKEFNLAIMGLWIPLFVGLMASDFLGKGHEGRTITFWEQACAQERTDACRRLNVMPRAYCVPGFESECELLCDEGSGTACYLLGSLLRASDSGLVQSERIRSAYVRACGLGNMPGCLEIGDEAVAVLDQSCEGATASACLQLGEMLYDGIGMAPERVKAAIYFSKACDHRSVEGCRRKGKSYLEGDGVPRIPELAANAFARACEAGDAQSCSDRGRVNRCVNEIRRPSS